MSRAGTILAVGFCSLVRAQSAANANAGEKLEFEVASIKPAALPGGGAIRLGLRGGPGSGDPARVTFNLSTIRDLMAEAYGVKRNQISGGPKWLDSDRFDIVAKVPAGTTKEQVKSMLQNLLAERFKLTLHRETRDMPVYALAVGAKGPKLKQSTAADAPPVPAEDGRGETAAPPPPHSPSPGRSGIKLGPDGCPASPPTSGGRGGKFMMITPNGECMISNGQTMDGLAAQLSDGFDRPVIDRTGLKGTYDLRLRYDPSSMPGGRGGPGMAKGEPGAAPAPGDPGNRIAPDGGPPSIFTALQEQLGLKLESSKGPVELLVIDHVERTPAQN